MKKIKPVLHDHLITNRVKQVTNIPKYSYCVTFLLQRDTGKVGAPLIAAANETQKQG